jgi:hypothetical protein
MLTPTNSVVRIDVPEFGCGGLTGFVLSSEHVLTCAHAAIPADEPGETISRGRLLELQDVHVRVRFYDGSEESGTALAYDSPIAHSYSPSILCAIIQSDSSQTSRLSIRLC